MPRVTISEPGKTPQPYRFKLERALIKVGRGSENDIIINCGSASTNHCYMERVKGGYVIHDTASTNGIKVDDTLMEVIDLYDGMEILVGDVLAKFQLSSDELETLGSEEFTSQQKKKLPPVDKNADKDTNEGSESSKPSTSAPRSTHSHRSQPTVQESGGAFKTLVVLFIMLIAIAAGMTLRHLKETGDFLPSVLLNGGKEPVEKTVAPNEEAAANTPDDQPTINEADTIDKTEMESEPEM